MNKRIKNILLDFDGTITDVDAESVQVISKWHELFCKATHSDLTQHIKDFDRIKNEVMTDEQSGWNNNGKIVAPATADPLILTTTVYQRLVDYRINEGSYPFETDEKSIHAALFKIFTESLLFSDIVFRDNAKEFLDTLASRYAVTIVTNSHTEPVQKKLDKISDRRIPIIGDAKKYIIDDNISYIPESLNLIDFPRPVLLKRINYHHILSRFSNEDTAVIGDVYEMDLALPEYMGFMNIQLKIPSTPKYEIARGDTSRHHITSDYDSVLKILEKE